MVTSRSTLWVTTPSWERWDETFPKHLDCEYRYDVVTPLSLTVRSVSPPAAGTTSTRLVVAGSALTAGPSGIGRSFLQTHAPQHHNVTP
jgi:hypothetical protein